MDDAPELLTRRRRPLVPGRPDPALSGPGPGNHPRRRSVGTAVTILGSFPDLCVADVGASLAFYRDLLELDVLADHGWYAELGVGGRTLVAFVTAGHDTVPDPSGARVAGVLVSFEVSDAAAVAHRAAGLGVEVRLALCDELGQRHLMVVDPDGALVDVIERIAMTRADLARLARLRRAAR